MTARAGRLRLGAVAILAVIAITVLYLVHLGYFGGPVFTDIPASATARPLRRHIAAVLLSGDMGFSVGMGPEVAGRLAADGIPVIAVNSLTYFRHRRTPREAAKLVLNAIERAKARYHPDQLLLIGQSYGADMLHVGLAGLPAAKRTAITQVILVVPEKTVEFRASPSEIFSLGEPEADALPTARRLGWTSTLCVHGVKETRSLCPLLADRPVQIIALPGGHPLHHDADTLYAVLRKAIVAAHEKIGE